MADCDNVGNTRVSGCSGVSLHLLEAHGSASRFLAARSLRFFGCDCGVDAEDAVEKGTE